MLSRDEVLAVVAEDLRYLLEDWDETIDDNSLRRNSTVLRRLLVDGELQRAWKIAGLDKEPEIVASTLAPVLQKIPRERIAFASAGGAHYGGMQIRGALMVNYAMTQEQLQNIASDGLPSETLGLRRFTEATCMVVEGHVVNRRILIKFIANRLGGAHTGSRKEKPVVERLYRLLDRARREVQLAEKSAVYFEFLSIGQALAAADDIRRLREAAAAA